LNFFTTVLILSALVIFSPLLLITFTLLHHSLFVIYFLICNRCWGTRQVDTNRICDPAFAGTTYRESRNLSANLVWHLGPCTRQRNALCAGVYCPATAKTGRYTHSATDYSNRIRRRLSPDRTAVITQRPQAHTCATAT